MSPLLFGNKKEKMSTPKAKLTELTTDSTVTRIQFFYPQLDEATIKNYKAQFKTLDKDNSGDLNLQEVKYMMEKMGQAKTHTELKEMIAEVDTDNSGTINFHEFLQSILGNPDLPKDEAGQMPNLFGKIYNSALASNAKYFEEEVFKIRDVTAENKDKIQKEAQLRKLEKEELKKQKEAEEAAKKEKEAKRAAMAERAKSFENK